MTRCYFVQQVNILSLLSPSSNKEPLEPSLTLTGFPLKDRWAAEREGATGTPFDFLIKVGNWPVSTMAPLLPWQPERPERANTVQPPPSSPAPEITMAGGHGDYKSQLSRHSACGRLAVGARAGKGAEQVPRVPAMLLQPLCAQS